MHTRSSTAILRNVPAESTTGILAFKVNSDGTTTRSGAKLGSIRKRDVQGRRHGNSERRSEHDGDGCRREVSVCGGSGDDGHAGLYVPGAVSVFAIGSGGSVTEVAGSPFFTSNPATTVPQVESRYCQRGADPDRLSRDWSERSAELGVLGAGAQSADNRISVCGRWSGKPGV